MAKSTKTQGEARVKIQRLSSLRSIAHSQNWFLKLCVEHWDSIQFENH